MAADHIFVTEKDLADKRLLAGKLNQLYGQQYKLLEEMAELARRSVAMPTAGSGGGLTEEERDLLRALSIGSTENPVAAQRPVIPTVSALPPVVTATPGELVHLSTDGLVYRFDGTLLAWEDVGAAAPGNMMTTDSSQSIALGVVKTWLARQVFTGGLDTGAQIRVLAGGIDIDAGGLNVDAGGIHVVANGIDVDAGGVNVDAGGVTVGLGGVNVNGGGVNVTAGGVIVTGGQFDSSVQFGARVAPSAIESIADGVLTAVTLATAQFNNGAVWAAGNPTRLTVPAGGAGIWLFVGQIRLGASAAGTMRYITMRANGGTDWGFQNQPPNATLCVLNASAIVSMSDADYMELCVYQNSGGALDTAVSLTWFGGYKLC